MPKTSAERQRERRARIKADPQLHNLHKAADRHRKKEKRQELSAEELKSLQNRTKLSTRKWREKKSANEQQPTFSTTPYGSLAAFTKAKNRVLRSLPCSPNKRSAVVRSIASRYVSDDTASPRRQSATGIEEHVKQAAIEFYESSSISRVAPGKADVITVRHPDGLKNKHQKRHMTMTLSEAFELFKLDNPTYKIGKSSFAELRPKHVLLTSQMPHNVCGCKYHNNMILLLESLHRKYPTVVPLYTKQGFVPLCVCDMSSEDCMSNSCDTCSDGKKFRLSIKDRVPSIDDELKWYQWVFDDNYLVKRQVVGTVRTALEHVQSQLPKFLWHVFIKDKQSSAYESDKDMAKQPDSTSCMLQMDFAENYTATFQDEIQSAHWKQKQITIYTVMIWARDVIKSSVVLSDVKDHEKKSRHSVHLDSPGPNQKRTSIRREGQHLDRRAK